MNMLILRGVLIVILCIGAFQTPTAYAQSLSQKEAIVKVTKAYPGKVLKTSSFNRNGTTFYRVRMLVKNGRVINVIVNANTGRMKKE